MYFIEKAAEFDKWFRKLNDLRTKAKILFRLQKLENEEHFGDCKPVGNGISELKINYAKGYIIYFKEIEERLLFCYLVETNQPNRKTFKKRKKFGTN